MKKRNIIVIGASAGGFNVLKQVVAGFPPDLDASIFIVWHMSPDIRGVLPDVLNKLGTIPAVTPRDKDPIVSNRIYVGVPDWHLMVEEDQVRVTRGPKENRFRPAIDPLFRSAAYTYGPRVIGVVLTGALDDGSSGLWTIKHFGGLAVVQDPDDAEFPSMPQHAQNAVEIDHVARSADMAALLTHLCATPVPEATTTPDTEKARKTKQELEVALHLKTSEDDSVNNGVLQFGPPTAYTCPDCHGVLSAIEEGSRVRYRCHTGHAFSADTLLTLISEKIESSLWNAVRGIEESVMLLNTLGDHYAGMNQPKLAATYFRKAKDAKARLDILRMAVWRNERLSEERVSELAKETTGE